MEATNYVKEMRDWLCECVWADTDSDEIMNMPESVILLAVARHYAGGIFQFIVDSKPITTN